MAGIRATLERYRVHFDRWFLEATLYEGEPSAWDRAREQLEADGHAYRHDGALWLRTTTLAGDEKDRPLVRSTGEPTYLAADVAYHWDKLERGYDTLVNVLGADHHNYVVRLRAIVAAAGADPDRLVVPLLQFVHVVEGGERASMSKRRGDFVTLEELIDEIGVDATRFFMLSRSADSTVDLDLTLAREQSAENPVYYVQYAHARIASVLRKAGEERVAAALAAPREGLVLEPAERELVKKLLAFPAEVAEAAERRAPHRIAVYALETAQAFTAFYRDCRVVGAEPEGLESFRHRPERRRPARHRPVAGAARRCGASVDVSSGGDRGGRQRPREVVALAEAAARLGDERELLGGLDALGDDVHPEPGAERRDRAHDRARRAVLRQVAQERAVDLEHLHGQRAQARERRVLGAEVVERELDAEPVQPVEHLHRAVDLVDRGLAHLDDQLGRVEPVARERVGDAVGVALVAQLARATRSSRSAAGSRPRPTPRSGGRSPRSPRRRCA